MEFGFVGWQDFGGNRHAGIAAVAMSQLCCPKPSGKTTAGLRRRIPLGQIEQWNIGMPGKGQSPDFRHPNVAGYLESLSSEQAPGHQVLP